MFVYVPASFSGEDLPEKAILLAKEAKLPIRIGELDDGIREHEITIIRVPEKKQMDYSTKQKAGLVVPIDYINEYEVIARDILVKVSGNDYSESFKPYILESHHAKFRFRIPNRGIYSFVIVSESSNTNYDGGEITID